MPIESTVKIEKFNNFYLPIQWTSDKNNNGTIDVDELWVHPNLFAINSYLESTGEEAIDPMEFVKPAQKFLDFSPGDKVGNPLLVNDLASRLRVKSKFDIESISDPKYREALKEFVKAAAYADLYYNLQRDPKYVEHLKDVLASGDLTQIRHFWQNGNAKCLSSKNKLCTSLPGKKLDPNGVWYPDEFTKKDIDFLKGKYKWKSDALKRKFMTPRSRIVECEKSDKDSFFYKDKWYRPVSINTFLPISIVALKMTSHLEAAADILQDEDPGFSNMVREIAQDIKTSPIYRDPEIDKLWATVNNKYLTISFGSIEEYEVQGSAYGIKALMQGVIVYNDPKLQLFFGGLSMHMAESDKRLWQIWEDRGENFPIQKISTTQSQIAVGNIIMNSGAMNAPGYVAGGFVQPNCDNYEVDLPQDQQPRKIVLFGTVMSARMQNQGLSLARLSFKEQYVKEFEEVLSDVSFVAMFAKTHEDNHTRAIQVTTPISVNGKSTSAQAEFGEHLSTSIEEAKADLLGIMDLKMYSEKGLITDEQRYQMYRSFAANLLRDIYLGHEDEHGHGSILEFYLLNKHGVISYDAAEEKYDIDYAKLEGEIPNVVKEFMEVYFSLNKETAEAFDKKALEYLESSPIAKHIKTLKDSNLPSDNLPYYEVIGNLGDF